MAADKVFSSDVAIRRGKVVNNVHGRHLDVDPPTEKVLWHVKAVMRCEIYRWPLGNLVNPIASLNVYL